MKFSDQPPSKQWAALKYRGERFAEVWFKPDGDPLALTFRIPPESFHIPDVGQRLTTELLLKAVAVAPEEVESWRLGGVSHAGMDGANPELRQPLPSPVEDDTFLSIDVRLNPPSEAPAPEEDGHEQEMAATAPVESAAEGQAGEAPADNGQPADGQAVVPDDPAARWHDLESRWRAVTEAEVVIDNLRLQLEGLQDQMETAAKKALTTEEKLHALKPDLAAWTKAKTRVHHASPKVKEFVHRATWVVGTPERKKMEELFKDEARFETPLPKLIKLVDQLENLLKDRQVLASHGVTVSQECRTVASGMQNALRTLQSNAAANADRKRRANRPKGKFFKHIRKWSGAD